LRLSEVWYLFVILYDTLLYYYNLFFFISILSFVSRYICTCGTYIIFLYIKVSKCIYSMMWLMLLNIFVNLCTYCRWSQTIYLTKSVTVIQCKCYAKSHSVRFGKYVSRYIRHDNLMLTNNFIILISIRRQRKFQNTL